MRRREETIRYRISKFKFLNVSGSYLKLVLLLACVTLTVGRKG